MNKKIVISLVIIILAGLGIWFFLCRDSKNGTTSSLTASTTQVSVQTVTNKRTSQYVSFDVAYPQFSGVDSSFNQKVKTLIETAMNDHETLSKENWNARRETASPDENISQYPDNPELFSFYATWTSATISDELVSFAVRFGGFSGGAHGYEAIVAFNYDVVNQKEILLKDVFLNDSNYLATISAYAISELKKQYVKNGIEIDDHITNALNEGAGPKEINFQQFTLKDNSITFYFEQYQVGPYVFGMPEVTMPIPQSP